MEWKPKYNTELTNFECYPSTTLPKLIEKKEEIYLTIS